MADREVESMADRLIEALDELTEAHEAMIEQTRAREAAVRRADPKGIGEAVSAQGATAKRVAAADRMRAEAAQFFAARHEVDDVESVTATWIGRRVGGERGERIEKSAAQLRERILALQALNASARIAVERLAVHMEGVARGVAARISHSGVYGASGRVESGPAVATAMDVTS